MTAPVSGTLETGSYPASVSLLESAARTTTQTVDFSPGAHEALVVVLTSQTQAGAGLTLSLQRFDPASGAWETILTAVKLSTVGTKTLLIGPYVAASANAAATLPIPPIVRAVVTVDDATSYTWSLAAHAS